MGNDRLEERYQAFVRNSSEGIWLAELDEPIPVNLSPQKQVKLVYKRAYMAEANDAMAKMYSAKSRSDLIGMRINQLLVESDPQNTEYLTAFVKSNYRLLGVESHEVDQNGNKKVFRNSLVGVVKDGYVLRAWGTQQDVTEQYLADEALRKSEQRLALAMKVSGMGLWEWDMADDTLTWSAELKKLFGLDPKEEITYKKYLSLLHREDRPHSRKVIEEAIKTGKEYRVEHRVVWPDKTVHWVIGRGKAFYENGKPVRMLGTTVSIEDAKRKAELEQINKELHQQQQELKRLNQAKDEFISLASHQLRTPATAVKQYLGMVLEGYTGDISKQQIDALSKAYISNERQLSIINDLLHIAQIDAGKVTLKKKEIDLSSMLKQIVADHADKFKGKKQTVKFKGVRSSIPLQVDPDRMRMALENIIENAHKYSPVDTTIRIEADKRRDKVQIEVIDQGIGIRKKDFPRLFEKFTRLEDPLMSEVSGTGLGLYWANKIISLHKGKLTIESRPGKGATFVITIPRVKTASEE